MNPNCHPRTAVGIPTRPPPTASLLVRPPSLVFPSVMASGDDLLQAEGSVQALAADEASPAVTDATQLGDAAAPEPAAPSVATAQQGATFKRPT